MARSRPVAQAGRDGVLYTEAGTRRAAANGDCAIHEVAIDDHGGFVAVTASERLPALLLIVW